MNHDLLPDEVKCTSCETVFNRDDLDADPAAPDFLICPRCKCDKFFVDFLPWSTFLINAVVPRFHE